MIDHGFGVSLLPLDKSVLEKVRGWRNDPRIYKWCRQTDLISDVDQLEWFEKQRKDLSTKMYVISNKELPVGVCGLTSIDFINRRAEFSLYIGPEYQRGGYGRQGLQTLFSHGFKSLGLHCIWGETFEGNPALGLFKELGFKVEGKRRDFYLKNGKFIDATLVSILATEWIGHG